MLYEVEPISKVGYRRKAKAGALRAIRIVVDDQYPRRFHIAILSPAIRTV
jgi:hypothetical protein